jgi:hypothetical protein
MVQPSVLQSTSYIPAPTNYPPPGPTYIPPTSTHRTHPNSRFHLPSRRSSTSSPGRVEVSAAPPISVTMKGKVVDEDIRHRTTGTWAPTTMLSDHSHRSDVLRRTPRSERSTDPHLLELWYCFKSTLSKSTDPPSRRCSPSQWSSLRRLAYPTSRRDCSPAGTLRPHSPTLTHRPRSYSPRTRRSPMSHRSPSFLRRRRSPGGARSKSRTRIQRVTHSSPGRIIHRSESDKN